jgi:hypothetical protein
VKQVVVPTESSGGAQFVLDFDFEGSLLGVEVLGVSLGLPRDTLESAQQQG